MNNLSEVEQNEALSIYYYVISVLDTTKFIKFYNRKNEIQHSIKELLFLVLFNKKETLNFLIYTFRNTIEKFVAEEKYEAAANLNNFLKLINEHV